LVRVMATQTVRLGGFFDERVVIWMDYNDANMSVSNIHADVVAGFACTFEVRNTITNALIGSAVLKTGRTTYNPPGQSVQMGMFGPYLTGNRSWGILTGEAAP
jgi:hypothetical protein